ncbi:hypothetical protein AB4Y45_40805 [Paraburkholderia sp. EG287A]|uniref:hypothetical protein n=1 Tax=unclassified Paraburkholderia TaxID=2615204 RepID=UPI0034D1B285
MFDAEIAATLLNRWDRKRAHPDDQSPLNLLQEGKLHFRRDVGDICTDARAADPCLRVECLTFADGQSGWSRWAAAESG